MARKSSNSGNISTTPEDVSTRTMREVTEVMRKNARQDRRTTPGAILCRRGRE